MKRITLYPSISQLDYARWLADKASIEIGDGGWLYLMPWTILLNLDQQIDPWYKRTTMAIGNKVAPEADL